jgi:hypothetical protein
MTSRMSAAEILKKLPRSGFLKIASDIRAPLAQDKRAALIRKGNEFFNEGKHELARRIFITTRYTDGLIRLGDLYFRRKKHLLALQIYWLAPCPEKVQFLVEKFASVISKWLMDGKDNEGL